MENIRNHYSEQIIALLDKAKGTVKIAMPWLTEEPIINKLIEIAPYKKVKLLLSTNYLNSLRYEEIVKLQECGATVLKKGNSVSGNGGFMHSKMVIIDENEVYGGSYNFTVAAKSNYENFDQYPSNRVGHWIQEFNSWTSDATDFKVGFENPDEIRKLVFEKFLADQEHNKIFLNKLSSNKREMFEGRNDEEAIVIKEEIRKAELKKVAIALQKQELKITNEGKTSTQHGVISPKHRNYGGNLRTAFNGQKLKNSYSFALKQKKEIENKFPFLRCRIENETLICRGTFQPENCNAYDVRIEFRAGLFPQVYILNQSIKPNADIHIYNEGSLCLFFPGDMKWKDTTSISEYTIPWVVEWIVVYELYLLTGKWEADFVPHGNVKAIAERKNEYPIAA